MPGIYLYGWDSVNEVWVKVTCDANGKLTVDPTAIFENPPTEDEDKKGPSSEWAFDHAADVAAHHAKFTAAEARAAINDILDADGKITAQLDVDFNSIANLQQFIIKWSAVSTRYVVFKSQLNQARLDVAGYISGGGAVAAIFRIYDGAAYQRVADRNWVGDEIDTHAADVDAHHAKYTDAEAQAACNLDGTIYWACPGSGFTTAYPDVDDITKGGGGTLTANADGIYLMKSLELPDGCTISSAVVYGNAAAEAETWGLRRVDLSDGTFVEMAGDNIGTVDSTISYATVDNENYAYILYTSSIDTNDAVYGGRVSYTL